MEIGWAWSDIRKLLVFVGACEKNIDDGKEVPTHMLEAFSKVKQAVAMCERKNMQISESLGRALAVERLTKGYTKLQRGQLERGQLRFGTAVVFSEYRPWRKYDKKITIPNKKHIRDEGGPKEAAARRVAVEFGCSKRSVYKSLNRMEHLKHEYISPLTGFPSERILERLLGLKKSDAKEFSEKILCRISNYETADNNGLEVVAINGFKWPETS